MAGLRRSAPFAAGDYLPPAVQLNAVAAQPRHLVSLKAKRHNEHIGFKFKPGVRDRLRPAAAVRARIAHLRADHLHRADLPLTVELNALRLHVKLKFHPLFPRVHHLFFRPGHA